MGRYICWSCGEKGDIFDWVMKTQRVEFPDAVRILAERAGVPYTEARQDGSRKRQEEMMAFAQRFFVETLASHKEGLAYCEQRGLTEDVRSDWGIGFGPGNGGALAQALKQEGHSLEEAESLFLVKQDDRGGYRDRFRSRLTIPIRNERGRVVAFGGRIVGDGMPKYINSSDTPLYRKSRLLFGMDLAKEGIAKRKHAILVEGYMDAIACRRSGLSNVAAVLGTSLTEEQAGILNRWTDQVVLLFDSDEAGMKAADRSAQMLLEAGLRVRVASPPKGQDPDDLLEQEGPDAVKALLKEANTPARHRLSMVREQWKPTQERYWIEAGKVLGIAANSLERDALATELAAEHPSPGDFFDKKQAVLAMMEKSGESAPESRSKPAPTSEPPAQRRIPFSHEENILALITHGVARKELWQVLRESHLFWTSVGQDLSREFQDLFPTSDPIDPPKVWMARLSPELVDRLMRLQEPPVDSINDEFVSETIQRLRDRQRRAENSGPISQDISADELRQIVERRRAELKSD